MESEESELLERVGRLEQLEKENNKMLRSMRRSMLWGRAWRIFYWLVIIGISIGVFYFLEPYIRGLNEFVRSITGRGLDELVK